jgi:hypothetical protein
MFGALAAGMFLLAVVIAALLHLKEPLAPLLLIGMAVAGSLGLLLLQRPLAATLIAWFLTLLPPGDLRIDESAYALAANRAVVAALGVGMAQVVGRPGSSRWNATCLLVLLYILWGAMAHYATGNRQALQDLARRSVRLLAVGLALPIGLLCGMGAPLLTLWLGRAFADLETVLLLLVAPLTINLATRPLSYVLTAYNEVKVQGLVTLGLGAANVVLAIALVRAGWSLAGVPAAAALVWTVRNVLFVSSRSAVLLGLRWYAFNGHLAIGLLGMAGVAALGRILCALWWPTDWLSLASFAAVIALAYGAFAYFIFMTKADRELVSSVFARRSAS